jgi:DNA processing protein
MVSLRRNAEGFGEEATNRYRPPLHVNSVALRELVKATGRTGPEEKQLDFLRKPPHDVRAYYTGNIELLSCPCVSIVGTRIVSNEGRARAHRLAGELTKAGIVIMSGLAKGVDTAALTSAMEHGGAVAAVIGTPLDKAYPSENADLQQKIAEKHVLLSPFKIGEPTYRSNFPKRNRLMAMLSDATAIVEASDNSGTLHQAAECQRLGRWLFILRAVVDNPSVSWPTRFLQGDKTLILDRTEQIIDALAHQLRARNWGYAPSK